MNKQEIEDFWVQCFQVVPGLQKYIDQNTNDASETLGAWSKALKDVTAREGLSVLARWSNGTLEPPDRFDWYRFHVCVLKVVKEDRNKNSGAKQREDAFRKSGVNQPRPKILARCGIAMTDIGRVMDKFNNGAITEEQKQQEIDDIVAREHANIDSGYVLYSSTEDAQDGSLVDSEGSLQIAKQASQHGSRVGKSWNPA